MKYLDEQIEVIVSQMQIPLSGVYTYEVVRQAQEGSSLYENVIFIGNTFIQSGTTATKFDLTEFAIIQKWDGNITTYFFPYDNGAARIWDMQRFFVRLHIGDVTYTSSKETVIMSFRYPNYKYYMDNPLPNIFTDNFTNDFITLLQGRYVENGISKFKLTPQYPLISTSNYWFAFTKLAGSAYADEFSTYKIENKEGDYVSKELEESVFYPIDVFTSKLSDVLNNVLPLDSGLSMQISANTNFTYNGTEEDGYYTEGIFTTALANDENTVFITNDLVNLTPLATANLVVGSSGDSRIKANIKIELPFTQELYDYITQTGTTNYFILGIAPNGQIEFDTTKYIYFEIDKNILKPLFSSSTLQINISITKNRVNRFISFDVSDVNARNISVFDNDLTLYVENNRVAELNVCPSRYYLMWQDRFGSYQSQKFNNKVSFTEKITKTKIYNNQREAITKIVDLQAKWKINSDWIDEELYPFYESIYVSPMLLLYDTENDKLYEVVLNGDYTEKTYRGEKKLLNITLDLELSKTQKILYR